MLFTRLVDKIQKLKVQKTEQFVFNGINYKVLHALVSHVGVDSWQGGVTCTCHGISPPEISSKVLTVKAVSHQPHEEVLV